MGGGDARTWAVGLAHEAPLLLEARRSQFGNYRGQTGKLANPMLGRSTNLVQVEPKSFPERLAPAQAADARSPDTTRRSRERKRRWSATKTKSHAKLTNHQ